MATSSEYQRRPVARSRSWALQSYITGLAGFAIAMLVGVTVGKKVIEERIIEFKLSPGLRSTPYDPQEHIQAYVDTLGVDAFASIPQQYLEVMLTRALHPIILGPLLIAAVVAVYVTWSSRS